VNVVRENSAAMRENRRTPPLLPLASATIHFENMKLTTPSARFASLLALLTALPALAQAHPGHSAIDWFSAAPHAGHDSEYAIWCSAVGVLTLAYGIYRLGTRKR
jgi:hypothetical protein